MARFGIAHIEIPQRKGDLVVVSRDEDIDKVRFEKYQAYALFLTRMAALLQRMLPT